jgi:outer membrane lipoprotein-sorting protein
VAEKREVDIVSVFRSRPALRWLVPSAAAVVVIGGGAAAGTIVASADPSLPDRSAAQLLVDIQNAKVDGLSGTIVESADLGLPAIAGLAGGASSLGGAGTPGGSSLGASGSAAGSGLADLATLLSGTNTAKVWYAGETKARIALVSTQGETDVIHNGKDVWLWSSKEKTASHLTLPADKVEHPGPVAGQVPKTPQEAADAALAAIDPTTKVTTTGAAKVAGRNAYELVLSPKDTSSLIGQVRLAIDAEHHIPLRVDVYAKNKPTPAIRVAFQQISFAVPDAEQFTFNPPPGTTVQQGSAEGLAQQHKAEAGKDQAQPQVIGKGWTAIVSAKLPKGSGSDAQQLDSMLSMLPKVSGSWGSGHEFAGTLFTVLVTDDGRVFAGAVTPQKLYEAAAK